MIISQQTKTWKELPPPEEVEAYVRTFFQLLRETKTDEARDSIAHQSDDWNNQLWSLWQNTYLLYLSIQHPGMKLKDSSFKGNQWKTDLSWLEQLHMDKFHWRRGKLKHTFYVSVLYAGQKRDVTCDFSLRETSAGFVVMREIFRVA